jgi:hypothetical protein
MTSFCRILEGTFSGKQFTNKPKSWGIASLPGTLNRNSQASMPNVELASPCFQPQTALLKRQDIGRAFAKPPSRRTQPRNWKNQWPSILVPETKDFLKRITPLLLPILGWFFASKRL